LSRPGEEPTKTGNFALGDDTLGFFLSSLGSPLCK
jgi:hypothetical protein